MFISLVSDLLLFSVLETCPIPPPPPPPLHGPLSTLPSVFGYVNKTMPLAFDILLEEKENERRKILQEDTSSIGVVILCLVC